jgi:hypothetical protein
VPRTARRSTPPGPPDQDSAHGHQHDTEQQLTDAHTHLVTGEPRHGRDEQDQGHTEDEQPDEALAAGVAGAGGDGG